MHNFFSSVKLITSLCHVISYSKQLLLSSCIPLRGDILTNKKSEIVGILTNLERHYLNNINRKTDYKKDFNIRHKTLKAFSDIIFILNNCSENQRIKIIENLRTYFEAETYDALNKIEETYGVLDVCLLEALEKGNKSFGRNLIAEFLNLSLELSIINCEKMWERHKQHLERKESHYFHRAQIANQQLKNWTRENQQNNNEFEPKNFFLKWHLKSTFFAPLFSVLAKYNLKLAFK